MFFQFNSKRKSENRLKKSIANQLWRVCSLFFLGFVIVILWLVFSELKKEYKIQSTLPTQFVFLNQSKITQLDDIEMLFKQTTFVENNDIYFFKMMISNLPWIKNVKIIKKWPDKVLIDVDEYVPKYRWQDFLYLDNEGIAFSIPEERIEADTFLQLYGEEGKEKDSVVTLEQFNQILNKLASKKIKFTILAAEVNRRGAWQLLMTYCTDHVCPKTSSVNLYQIKIKLGKENILQRFQHLVDYLPEIVAKLKLKDRIILADLRNDNGIIIKTERIEE